MRYEPPPYTSLRVESDPDWHPVRRRRVRANAPVPACPQGRRSRRLSRHEGRRPLSLARGPRFPRIAGLDRRREPAHRGLPLSDPAAGGAPPAPDDALELSEVRRAIPQGGALLLFQERRAPEPVGAVQAGLPHGRPRDVARSQPALRRRHRGRLDAGGVRRRAAPRLRDLGERDRKSTRLNSSHGYISYAV